MKKLEIISISIIIISFIIGLYTFQFFPEKIASHWGLHGEANKYTNKFFGLFFLPFIMMLIFGVLTIIPKIDPLKKNIEDFIKYYNTFILMIILFIFYIYLLTIAWNFGYKFNMNFMFIPVLGLLFIYTGSILNKLQRNWFIGIRTPWTMSSDKVWKKTHKLGSKLFKISGIIILFGIFFIDSIWIFVLVPIIISVIWLIIYSYLEYKKEKK
jgi:uncharacterized membrane protein